MRVVPLVKHLLVGLSAIGLVTCGVGAWDASQIAGWSGAMGWTKAPSDLTSVMARSRGGNHCLARWSDGSVVVSGDARLTVLEQGPAITGQPQALSAFLGGDVNVVVAVEGSLPMAFQWFLNGQELPGETNATLAIESVTEPQRGSYQLVISNHYGTTTSSNILLEVLPFRLWGKLNNGIIQIPNSATNVVALALADSFVIGLKQDGNVLAWGMPSARLNTRVPAGLSNVVAIAAGIEHSLALSREGTVTAWGVNSDRKTNVPPLLRENVAAIAAGANHSLALSRDGDVYAWGNNDSGQCKAPAAIGQVVAVGAGFQHSVALRQNGTVIAWGNNLFGQTNVPTNLHDVISIAVGGDHTLALLNQGTIAAWGWNKHGQTNVPPGLSNVVAIAAGLDHSMALLEDGRLLCWGANDSQQCMVPAVPDRHLLVVAGGGLSGYLSTRLPANTLVPIQSWKWRNYIFSINTLSSRGRFCRLEFQDNLGQSHWELGIPVWGDDTVITLEDWPADADKRFYRIRVQP